ncbi:dapper1-like [Scleropages formosus]|nr:dapper1-like [Scleropages formosus]
MKPSAPRDGSLLRDRREQEVRCRERLDVELERLRTRERLEATLAGLGELEYLRQRQEALVRSAICREQHQQERRLSSEEEEKLLGENILLLRKQLNCLRRRDAGLISQLQELDRQISDLRLDTEKASRDHAESDSRPSSGFYELSDGTSGSLSNSSNSVFSECLSSCRSSTCFCSPFESSPSVSEGRLKSADDLVECMECEGQCEDQSSGSASRSFSAPYSPSAESACDGHSKYHCDLVTRNGSDVYHYPSPLHAVAVQSPMFFQSLISQFKEESTTVKASETLSDVLKPEQPLTSQNASWPTSHTSFNKRLDNYIFGLLQRRSQPLRTNKPRTSINTDHSKSILRQGSLCVRQTSCQAQAKAPDHKTKWQGSMHASTINSVDTGAGSLLRQWAVEAKAELPETGKSQFLSQLQNEHLINNDNDAHTNSLSKKMTNKGLPLSTSKNYQDLDSPHAVSSPKDNKYPHFPSVGDSKDPQVVEVCSPKKCPKSPPAALSVQEERPILELVTLGSSSQSQDECRHKVNAQFILNHRQIVKVRKGGKNVKVFRVKSSTLKSRMHTEPVLETGREKQRTGIKKCRFPDDLTHPHIASKKSSCRAKRIPASIPEGRVVDKHPPATMGKMVLPRHQAHGRETVFTKPKYKRGDYRRLKSINEVPCEEALRRAHRHQKREILGHIPTVYLPSNMQYPSPYAYVGSDSEYSAECASLFHSTILDTSDDEQSNYTTNCFGDSESSVSEVDFVGESTNTSDSEGSGGTNWRQFGHITGPCLTHELTSAQDKTFVKIKASHNLKKKILRFRSGSLKLMTTV